MANPIQEAIYEAYLQADNDWSFDFRLFEEALNDQGFMIVPIEDPTNLFGVMEDNL